MAMMISKFHRLIQNKITWWVVLVIIIFSFVIWGSQSGSSGSDAQRQTAAAMLQDKPVEHAEFRSAYAGTHLGLVLQYGRDINITPQIDDVIRKQAWQRIAALREADRLGISASEDEVWAMTQQLPFFRTKEGQFSMQAYENFVGQFLPQKLGMTKHGFDVFMREEITLQKAGLMIARLMLIPPADTRRYFQAMNDRFVVEHALLTPDLVTNSVKTGRDEAKALFDKDPAAYRIPEMAVVRYVAIPYSNFVAKAEVKDDEVQKYYNDHIDEFVIPSTNSAKAASTNAEFSTETTKYRPLDEVKPKIIDSLKQIAATEGARSNALAFIELTQGRPPAKPMTFDEAAQATGFRVETSKPFAELGEVPGLEVGSDFNRTAFSLTGEDGSNVGYEPVKGLAAWYVLAHKDRLPERIPSFDEVIDQVIPDAQQQAVSDALIALAKKTRDDMDAAAKAGRSVADAARKHGVTLKTTEPFSASEAGSREDAEEEFKYLIRGVLTHNAGEVTDLLPVQGRGIIVAHVKSRAQADMSAFDQLRPQIANQIRRSQGRQLFDGWQEYLLKRDKFEDLLKKATTQDG